MVKLLAQTSPYVSEKFAPQLSSSPQSYLQIGLSADKIQNFQEPITISNPCKELSYDTI